jgi:hypothetical protein
MRCIHGGGSVRSPSSLPSAAARPSSWPRKGCHRTRIMSGENSTSSSSQEMDPSPSQLRLAMIVVIMCCCVLPNLPGSSVVDAAARARGGQESIQHIFGANQFAAAGRARRAGRARGVVTYHFHSRAVTHSKIVTRRKRWPRPYHWTKTSTTTMTTRTRRIDRTFHGSGEDIVPIPPNPPPRVDRRPVV